MGFLVYFTTVALLIAAFVLLPKTKKTRAFGIILVAAVVAAELFIFNFHSFRLVGGDYEEISLNVADAKKLGFKLGRDDIVSNDKGAECSLEINNINKRVGTLKIELDYPTDIPEAYPASKVDVSLDIANSTHTDYVYENLASASIVRGDERSECIVLQVSGDIKDMVINLRTEEDRVFEVRSVTLNAPKTLELSTFRLAVIVGLVFGLYALFTFAAFKEPCREKRRFLRGSFAAVTLTFVGAAVVLTALSNVNLGYAPISLIGRASGDQITQELVDAFKAGQLHLLEKPSEELLALNNPYDWSQRAEADVTYLLDHLLFDGKYYSYYGIAPVLLLFLPYNLITGLYFPTAEAVLLFGAVGIVFLSLLYFEIVKRFFGEISLGIAITSLAILQLCSGIFFCFCTPLFYEIAQASGFAFSMMGAYFLVRSGVIGAGRISRIFLCLSSLCLSIAVLCRPTLAVYCVAALVFIAIGFFKDRAFAKEQGGYSFKRGVGYFASALTCFAVVGAVQMLYNYARFGSPFDFGIQYSLTIHDFTGAEFFTDLTMVGFWNYLFAFPIIDLDFPFVFSNFSRLDVNGFYFVANECAVGIFWRALPTLGYLGAIAALRRLDKKKRAVALLTVLPVCVIAPLTIIFSIWESGYGIRYSVDFAIQIILGGMAVLYCFYQNGKEENREQTRMLIEKFFAISLFVALVVNFAMVYDYFPKGGTLSCELLKFERIFEFWR